MPVPKPITYEQFKKEVEESKKNYEKDILKQFKNQGEMLKSIELRESLEKDKKEREQDKKLAETLRETRRLHEIAQNELDEKARKKKEFDEYEEVDLENFIEELEKEEKEKNKNKNKNKCTGPGCSIMGGKKNKTKKNRKNNKKSKRNRRR
jgi:regulator of protease activity HflC (stomatin/prohibitin superfamily)